jgi:hypothetical protein
MAFGQLPGGQGSSGHTPVVRITARRTSASRLPMPKPPDMRLAREQDSPASRTDHLFLRCPEQHRRTLEPAP